MTDVPPGDPRDALIREQAQLIAAQAEQIAALAEQIAALEAVVAGLREQLGAAARAGKNKRGKQSSAARSTASGTTPSRPLPGPEPEPERPGRCPQDTLNHPALTGMDPADVQKLATALEVPFGVRREQDSYIRRGGQRVRYPGQRARHGNRKIDVLDHVLALRLRDHLHLTTDLAGALLGADRSTISHATSLTRQLLAAAGIPLPAAAPPPACAPPMTCAATPPQPGSPSPSPAPGHQRRNTPGADRPKPATHPRNPTK